MKETLIENVIKLLTEKFPTQSHIDHVCMRHRNLSELCESIVIDLEKYHLCNEFAAVCDELGKGLPLKDVVRNYIAFKNSLVDSMVIHLVRG